MHLLAINFTDFALTAILVVVLISLCLIIWILAINKMRWEAEKEDYASWEELQDKTAYIGYLESTFEDIKDRIAIAVKSNEQPAKALADIKDEIDDLQDEWEFTARKRASDRDTKN